MRRRYPVADATRRQLVPAIYDMNKRRARDRRARLARIALHWTKVVGVVLAAAVAAVAICVAFVVLMEACGVAGAWLR